MIEVFKVDLQSLGYQECLNIRKEVFVKEQKVSFEDEVDEYEGDCHHFLAKLDGQPVGAARWRELKDCIKLERFAVLREFRGKSIGTALVRAVLEDIQSEIKSPVKLLLHSQLDAIPLYKKFDFKIEGDIFEECGILHKTMSRML